jgi:hypothetical protein
VGQDLLDHRPLEDGRDGLQLTAAAVRAVLHVNVKDAPEQPCQAQQMTCSRPAVRQYPLVADSGYTLGVP